MGRSLAWLAARNLPFEATLDRLPPEATGEPADCVTRALTGCRLPTGWSLVVAHGSDHRIIDARELAVLSRDCELVACSVEEHVMCSRAERWAHGPGVWRIIQDAQESFGHLSADGDLPDEFDATRRRIAEPPRAAGGSSAGVDQYFEIPLVLAQARVGFKHDEARRPNRRTTSRRSSTGPSPGGHSGADRRNGSRRRPGRTCRNARSALGYAL